MHILPILLKNRLRFSLFLASAILLLLMENCPLAVGDEDVTEVSGDALISAAVDSLLQHPGLEAKIRQRATVFDQLVSGAGLYVQAHDMNRLLVRYEFKIQVADKSMALLQINDGMTLWIRRDVDQLQSQAYVDLRRLRDSLQRQSNSAVSSNPVGSNPVSSQMLAIGGLAQLLRSFSENFQFGNATASEVSNVPMWELTGEWKTEQLLRLLPDQRAQMEAGKPVDVTKLPDHLPTTVKLTLGRDRNFPLFPYRIEYGRLQPVASTAKVISGKTASPTIHPMVTMELFEVRRRNDVPRELFKYSPGDQKVEDQTDSYLSNLRVPATK